MNEQWKVVQIDSQMEERFAGKWALDVGAIFVTTIVTHFDLKTDQKSNNVFNFIEYRICFLSCQICLFLAVSKKKLLQMRFECQGSLQKVSNEMNCAVCTI